MVEYEYHSSILRLKNEFITATALTPTIVHIPKAEWAGFMGELEYREKSQFEGYYDKEGRSTGKAFPIHLLPREDWKRNDPKTYKQGSINIFGMQVFVGGEFAVYYGVRDGKFDTAVDDTIASFKSRAANNPWAI